LAANADTGCHVTRHEAEGGEMALYMVWWQDDQNNYLLRNVTVLESELRRGAKDRLDYDFPKFVQARTDVRVRISTSPNNARQHIDQERLKLSAPFGRRIAEPLDADAAGQATFYGRFNKIGCEEGERDGHIDLSNAALLASAKLSDRGHST